MFDVIYVCVQKRVMGTHTHKHTQLHTSYGQANTWDRTSEWSQVCVCVYDVCVWIDGMHGVACACGAHADDYQH